MSTKLEQYREEIISINNQILDLLSKEGISSKIGEKKLSKVLKFMTLNEKRND